MTERGATRASGELVGDWLLVAGDREPRGGRTEAPWRRVARLRTAASESLSLWIQDVVELGGSTPRWIGAPWIGAPWWSIDLPAGGGRAWLFGELTGASSADQVARRVREALSAGTVASLPGRWTLLASGRRTDKDPLVELWTDRFGTQHVYRAEAAGGGAIGSSFRAVAACSDSSDTSDWRSALDWAGILGFCACGFFLGTRTHLESLRLVRPARRLWMEPGGAWREEATWTWRAGDDPPSFDDAVDEYDALLRAVIRDQTVHEQAARDSAGRIAVPISGGLDSRSTVAALPDELLDGSRDAPWAYSYGWSPRSIETRIARRVGAARGLDVSTIVLERTFFDRLPAIDAALEGFSDLLQCRQAGIAHVLRPRADAVLAAHWGDVWHDSMLSEPAQGNIAGDLVDRALAKVVKAGREPLVEALFDAHPDGPPLDEPPRQVLRRMVADELERVSAALDDPDLRLKAFKTEQWSFRWTLSSLRAYQLAAVPRLPFYDPRLTDFFLRLPTAYVAGRRLQIEHLKRHAPALARVRWQEAGASLHFAGHRRLLLPKRALEKLVRVATRHRPIERNWEVQLTTEDGVLDRARLERHLTAPGLRIAELVEPATVRGWIDELDVSLRRGRPAGALGSRLTTLLTLAVALEGLP